MSAARADEVFADPEYTRRFLAHLEASTLPNSPHQWLRGRLTPLLAPTLLLWTWAAVNPFADLPCRITGLDRHDRPGNCAGKMEDPPLPNKSADVLIYSLSLYGQPLTFWRISPMQRASLRGRGHLFISTRVAFTSEGLVRFVNGLHQSGFELVGSVRTCVVKMEHFSKGMHLTLTGETGKTRRGSF